MLVRYGLLHDLLSRDGLQRLKGFNKVTGASHFSYMFLKSFLLEVNTSKHFSEQQQWQTHKHKCISSRKPPAALPRCVNVEESWGQPQGGLLVPDQLIHPSPREQSVSEPSGTFSKNCLNPEPGGNAESQPSQNGSL